jgi:hypothetical protein
MLRHLAQYGMAGVIDSDRNVAHFAATVAVVLDALDSDDLTAVKHALRTLGDLCDHWHRHSAAATTTHTHVDARGIATLTRAEVAQRVFACMLKPSFDLDDAAHNGVVTVVAALQQRLARLYGAAEYVQLIGAVLVDPAFMIAAGSDVARTYVQVMTEADAATFKQCVVQFFRSKKAASLA